jgi:hypothetical protein
MKMQIKQLIGVVLCPMFLLTQVAFADDTATFDQLKSLEGEWSGILNSTNGDSSDLKLKYTIRSNGSALLEESTETLNDEAPVEMLNIFNVQNGALQTTHYCGLMNKPVGELATFSNGILTFKIDPAKSGLEMGKEAFVTSWKLSLLPEDNNKFLYEYTVINEDETIDTSTAVVTRVL